MKRNVSPVVAVIVIVLAVAIAAWLLWKFTTPGMVTPEPEGEATSGAGDGAAPEATRAAGQPRAEAPAEEEREGGG